MPADRLSSLKLSTQGPELHRDQAEMSEEVVEMVELGAQGGETRGGGDEEGGLRRGLAALRERLRRPIWLVTAVVLALLTLALIIGLIVFGATKGADDAGALAASAALRAASSVTIPDEQYNQSCLPKFRSLEFETSKYRACTPGFSTLNVDCDPKKDFPEVETKKFEDADPELT